MASDKPPIQPYGRHHIDDDDIAAVVEVLRGDFLTTGPVVEAFEARLAEITGARHAVVVSSGTAALHLAAIAADLGPGDVAIVPTLTFLATANAARYVGADVVFADVDADTGLLTGETFAAALAKAGSKGKAVLPVHVNGQTVDMAALSGIENLTVIEDACHALGGAHRGPSGEMVAVGSCAFGEMAVFSFHPVKTIAMGEGGAITTNSDDLAEMLRRTRNIGMTRDPARFEATGQAFRANGKANPWYYEMPDLGFNYRASAIHAALGLSQLGKLDQFVATRARLRRRYEQALAPLVPVVRPIPVMPACRPAWHLAVVLIDFAAAGVDRATVMDELTAIGVGAQVHYLPVHRQPYYRKLYGEIDLPGADAYYARALSLPLHVGMSEADVDAVVDALARVLGGGG